MQFIKPEQITHLSEPPEKAYYFPVTLAAKDPKALKKAFKTKWPACGGCLMAAWQERTELLCRCTRYHKDTWTPEMAENPIVACDGKHESLEAMKHQQVKRFREMLTEGYEPTEEEWEAFLALAPEFDRNPPEPTE